MNSGSSRAAGGTAAVSGAEAARARRASPLRILANARALVPGILIVVLWEAGALYLFDPEFVGQPSLIFESFAAHVWNGDIWNDVWVTFREIAIGYALGVLIGALIGYALGTSQLLADVFEPYILAFNAIPKVAIAPLLIVALGIGIASKIAIIVSLVFFLMFYSVFVGIRLVEVDFIYQARVMGASRLEVVRYVILPAIMPNVLVGMKTSAVYAVIGAVIGEFIAANAGLGYFILDSAGAFNVTDIWVGVIFLMAIVLSITGAVTLVERRLLRWLPKRTSG